jgi:hypothetical protein
MQMTTALSSLSSLLDQRWEELGIEDEPRVRELLGLVRLIAREEQHVHDVRVAEVFAWAKGRDLSDAGFRSFRSFVKKLSPLGRPAGPVVDPNDPSIALLWPWIEPRDVNDAVTRLRAIRVFRDTSRLLLGRAYDHIHRHRLWRFVPDCWSLGELCLVHLELPLRSVERDLSAARRSIGKPLSRHAVETVVLAPDPAIRSLPPEVAIKRWLDLVHRLGVGGLAPRDHEVDN